MLVSCLFLPLQSATLWRMSAVKLLLILVDRHHCPPDSILHKPSPLCTLWCPPAGTHTFTQKENTQTYAADTHCPLFCGWAYDGWSCEGPFHLWTHPFLLLPPCQDTVSLFNRGIGLKITPNSGYVTLDINNNLSCSVEILVKFNELGLTESYLVACVQLA